MTDKQFYTLFGAALESTDRDAYISEWATSSMFDPDSDGPAPDYAALVDKLGNIWDVAHMTVAEIRATTGLSQGKFGERFCIPMRTIQNWEAGRNLPGEGARPYVRLMMAELLGLLRRD